jgi:hypothetical protein
VLKVGDVLLGRALYANCWPIAELAAAVVDVVLRQRGSGNIFHLVRMEARHGVVGRVWIADRGLASIRRR